MSDKNSKKTAQVIDISNKLATKEVDANRIIRISPETDGLAMLYGNDANPGKLFSMNNHGLGINVER